VSGCAPCSPQYDEENRLRSASGPNTVTYQYDPLGRRASKSVNGTITQFLSDDQEEIGEYVSGTVQRYYINGHDIDEHLAQVETSGAHYFYSTNHQGSILASTDSSQAITTYDYGPYGESAAPATGVAFRYTGRRLDWETGLYYYRARYYSPTLGRFLQTDPIGTKDDLKLYAYVGNDPLDKTDPSGSTCVAQQDGTQNCTVDSITNKDGTLTERKDFTDKQKASVAKLDKAYTNTVNALAKNAKGNAQVKGPDGKSTNVNAGKLASVLEKQNFTVDASRRDYMRSSPGDTTVGSPGLKPPVWRPRRQP
jgi:RHS repeat-associated protein